MTESQKIVFKEALKNFRAAFPRKEIVSGAALGLHKDKDGNKKENKWSNWAKESDQMDIELKKSLRYLTILEKEILNS